MRATSHLRRETLPSTVCLFKHLDLSLTIFCAIIALKLTFVSDICKRLQFCKNCTFFELAESLRNFHLMEKLFSALLIGTLHQRNRVQVFTNSKEHCKELLPGRFHRKCQAAMCMYTGKKKLLLYMCFLWAKPAHKLLFQVKCKSLFLVFIEVVSLCFNWKLNLIFLCCLLFCFCGSLLMGKLFMGKKAQKYICANNLHKWKLCLEFHWFSMQGLDPCVKINFLWQFVWSEHIHNNYLENIHVVLRCLCVSFRKRNVVRLVILKTKFRNSKDYLMMPIKNWYVFYQMSLI